MPHKHQSLHPGLCLRAGRGAGGPGYPMGCCCSSAKGTGQPWSGVFQPVFMSPPNLSSSLTLALRIPMDFHFKIASLGFSLSRGSLALIYHLWHEQQGTLRSPELTSCAGVEQGSLWGPAFAVLCPAVFVFPGMQSGQQGGDALLSASRHNPEPTRAQGRALTTAGNEGGRSVPLSRNGHRQGFVGQVWGRRG